MYVVQVNGVMREKKIARVIVQENGMIEVDENDLKIYQTWHIKEYLKIRNQYFQIQLKSHNHNDYDLKVKFLYFLYFYIFLYFYLNNHIFL
jgi:hypothetical protein